jgi:hypothetical protein
MLYQAQSSFKMEWGEKMIMNCECDGLEVGDSGLI